MKKETQRREYLIIWFSINNHVLRMSIYLCRYFLSKPIPSYCRELQRIVSYCRELQ